MSADRMQADGTLLVSVVICTRKRTDLLRQAIASVVSQDFPSSDYEVLVIDNGSTDHTRQVVTTFAASANVRYLLEEELGLCVARNTGWRAAAGRYVAYFDDDAIAMPGWLAATAEGFETITPMPGLVGGRVIPLWEQAPPAWLDDHAALSLTIVDWGDVCKPIADIRCEWLVGTNMVVERRLLEEVDGFHPWLGRVGSILLSGEEVFLQKQIMHQGHSCLYHPGMAVRHLIPAARLNQRWFHRRFFWQGVSDAVMHLIEHTPSPSERLKLAGRRTVTLLVSGKRLAILLMPTQDPQRVTQKCFALIELGFISGLLGAARH